MLLGPGGRELEWLGQRGQSVEQEPEDLGERAAAIHVVMGRGARKGAAAPRLAGTTPSLPAASVTCRSWAPAPTLQNPPQRSSSPGTEGSCAPPPICLSRSRLRR